MSAVTILIADDDFQIRMLLRDRLEASGYRVQLAENGKNCLKVLKENSIDLMLLDLQMPDMGGLDVLKYLKEKSSELPVIVLTAHGTIEQAVEAMKLGATDFLPKPCKPDHLMLVIRKTLNQKDLQAENQFLRETLKNQYSMVTGKSEPMRQVMEIAGKVAKSKTTVLIGGESGTGKQLLAHAIHQMSDRKNRPFIQVNCITLPEQLTESDLFGHEKGAFTGAVKQKPGRFELADKGTIFLDEIGDLAPAIQAKLLQVIEYGQFQRVGGTAPMVTDVRVICATHKDLQKEVREGLFREDLFYRLNVMHLKLPALRERRCDIPELVSYFVEKHCRSMQKETAEVTPAAMEILKTYHWPGNIRELGNVIERAVVLMTNSKITEDLLPVFSSSSQTDIPRLELSYEEAVLQFKKNYIRQILSGTGNNQTEAAKILKIQRTYLNRLIRELGI
jgi:DNA-binding NtrC family response regulator